MADSAYEDDFKRGLCGDDGGAQDGAHLRHRRLRIHGRLGHIRAGRDSIRVRSARAKRGNSIFYDSVKMQTRFFMA